MSTNTNSQIARRYAEALFGIVQPDDGTTILNEFKQVLLVLQDPEISRVFKHPRTSLVRKSELIRLMDLSKTMRHFLLLTIEKSREQLLPQIEKRFEALILNSQQTTIAEIISAVDLLPETLTKLQQRLEELTAKTVRLNTSIDPKIGGGLIIKVDGKVIDGSIAHSLENFQRTLTS